MTTARVKAYLTAGAQLKMSDDRVVLSVSPRRQVTLRQDSGKITPAGRAWEVLTGRVLMAGGFLPQTPQREGNVETVKLRNGKRSITRRWLPAQGKWRFTPLGKRYYRTLTRHAIVSIPTYKIGRRRDGSTYQINNIHVPLSVLGINKPEISLDMDEASRYDKIKQLVLNEMGEGALLSHSDETWFYDPEGEWKISEETVGVDPETKKPLAVVNALERPLGAKPLDDPGFLLYRHILREAFVEHPDRLCVPRQIAHILRKDLGELGELRQVTKRKRERET